MTMKTHTITSAHPGRMTEPHSRRELETTTMKRHAQAKNNATVLVSTGFLKQATTACEAKNNATLLVSTGFPNKAINASDHQHRLSMRELEATSMKRHAQVKNNWTFLVNTGFHNKYMSASQVVLPLPGTGNKCIVWLPSDSGLLAAGCWSLAAGYWLLAAGCWQLAAGPDRINNESQ